MPEIKIKIRDKRAGGTGTIICGNSDYTVVWDLDAEWAAYDTKTMRVNQADGTSDMSTDRMEELYSNILDEMEAGDYLSREDIIGAKEVSVKLRIEVEGVVRDGTALVCVAGPPRQQTQPPVLRQSRPPDSLHSRLPGCLPHPPWMHILSPPSLLPPLHLIENVLTG